MVENMDEPDYDLLALLFTVFFDVTIASIIAICYSIYQ